MGPASTSHAGSRRAGQPGQALAEPRCPSPGEGDKRAMKESSSGSRSVPSVTSRETSREAPRPAPSAKRRHDTDADTGADVLPSKRARQTRASAQQSGVRKLEEGSTPKGQGKRASGSDNHVAPQPKRSRLTRQNLALFDKMGRKKGTSGPSVGFGGATDASSVQTKSISTTSSGFEAQATKNGILLSITSKRPENFNDLVSRLNQARQSVSPTPSIYEDYVDTINLAVNEATTTAETVTLLKGYRDRGYTRAWNQAFTAYPKNVGFNNGLSAPQPDFVQGFTQLEFKPFPVGEELDSAVLYHDRQTSIALPHFAGEWKGPGNDMDQAALQSAYDGAALVYSRNEALAYMDTFDPAGHASVLTVTTDGRAVNIFGHYAAPSDGEDQLSYHQYRLTAAHMDESYEDFKKGRKQLRNAQDFAREQSYQLRDQLRDYWKTHQQGLDGPTSAHPLPDAGEALPLDGGAAAVSTWLTPDEEDDGYGGYEDNLEPTNLPPPPLLSDSSANPPLNPPPNPPPNPSPPRRATTGGAGRKRRAPSPSSSRLSKASKGHKSRGTW